jgi:hypothetical protein
MTLSTRLIRSSSCAVVVLAAVAVSACASEPAGVGELEIRAWGEEFIEVGVPADAMADGWSVSFARFEVSISDLEIAGVAMADPGAVDLALPSDGVGHRLGRISSVAAGEYDDARFTLTRAIVEGSASNGGVTKTFAWTFEVPTRYSGCETRTVVPADGVGEFQITVHADHLFFASLVAEDPDLRFAALAAADDDGDGDGVITQAELQAAGLGSYDPGNLDIADLWAFLVAQAGTMGHVDGEGHCDAEPV